MTAVLDERLPQPVPDLYDVGSLDIADWDGGLLPSLSEEETPSPALEGKRTFRWSIPLTVLGLSVSLLTAVADQHLDPGLWGLPGSIYPTWYLGLALIIAGIATARRSDGVEVGVGVTALVIALTATPAIVYDLPRLPWAEKHVGVVNYILHYGQVHANIDIYQAWPGLFSAIAWLSRVGAVHNPMVIARIWPPVINVLELFAVRCFAGRLLVNRYRAWLATAVFMLSSAFNLDYFSPQAISLFLALGIYAIAVPPAISEGSVVERFRLPEWRIGMVVVLSLALAVTHQITPYFVVASLAVLVLFGLLRPLWIPLVPLIPAAAWALINYSSWAGYFSFAGFGNVAANVSTPGASIPGEHPDIVLRLSTLALAGGPFVVGLLAVVFLLRNRKRLDIALAVCAASAGSIVVATNYGEEGLYRATLFALPWLCVLAIGSGPKVFIKRNYVLVPLLALLSMSFIFANFALDGWNVIRPSQIQAESTFELHASPGSYLMSMGVNPPNDFAYRYPELQEGMVYLDDKHDIPDLVHSMEALGTGFPSFYS